MKRILLATAAALALGSFTQAQAADMPANVYTKAPAHAAATAVRNWGGLYLGVNGGYGSTAHEADYNGAALGSHDATGAVFGGQIGYRWQVGTFVFGVEAQGDWANLEGSHALTGYANRIGSSKVDGLGLFTAQVGYGIDNVLLYAKGGAGVQSNKFEVTDAAGATVLNAKELGMFETNAGWGGVLGLGLEYAIAPNWSVAVEWDHLFTENRDIKFYRTNGAYFGTATIKGDTDLATARINYRF